IWAFFPSFYIGWLQYGAAHACYPAIEHHEFIYPMAEFKLYQSFFCCFSDAFLKGSDHSRPGAPGDMEPRNRVAVPNGAIPAPLRPPDNREETQALFMEPVIFFC